MTRYSRSVIPGRAQEGEGDSNENLDRAVFGAKKRPITPPANDREDYPDPMDMDLDEAGHLVERSERRKPDERRKPSGERRKASDRRSPDFPPLHKNGVNYRTADDGKRGPILLVGALVIVAVFGVVVWSAYRDGVKSDEPDAAAPQLATAGAFKTPPHQDAATTNAEPAQVLEQLDGGPAPVGETRPEPAAVPAPAPVVTPAPVPSKVTAVPPAPLKPPAAAPAPAPVQQAAAKPVAPVEVAVATVAPAVTKPANAPIQLAKPAVAPAAMPAPAPAETGVFKAAFAANGSWVAQIAAASSEPGAIAEWDRRAKAMPEFFSGAERYVVQADVNGKTVYRLRAGPFGSKADADAYCAAFKAKGGNCFPAAK